MLSSCLTNLLSFSAAQTVCQALNATHNWKCSCQGTLILFSWKKKDDSFFLKEKFSWLHLLCEFMRTPARTEALSRPPEGPVEGHSEYVMWPTGTSDFSSVSSFLETLSFSSSSKRNFHQPSLHKDVSMRKWPSAQELGWILFQINWHPLLHLFFSLNQWF